MYSPGLAENKHSAALYIEDGLAELLVESYRKDSWTPALRYCEGAT